MDEIYQPEIVSRPVLMEGLPHDPLDESQPVMDEKAESETDWIILIP